VKREEIIAVYNCGVEAVISLVDGLVQRMEGLERKVAQLERDSTNSNKPPSSDGPKTNRGTEKRGASGRKPGGQEDHPGRTRMRVPESDISEKVDHKPTNCEQCGEVFLEESETEVVERRQVFEIPEIKPTIIEHIFYKTTCKCGHQTRLAVPEWIFSGTGERLQTHMSYFTSEARLSRRGVERVMEEVFHIPMGLGTVQNRLEDTSEVLGPICKELEELLLEQSTLNIDETSYPHNKKLAWLWVFVASGFVFFAIRASRASKVLKELLGELFDGIIICDRFSAYVKYQKDRGCGLMQFCWAHIIRDVKGVGYALAQNSGKPFAVLMRVRIGAVFRMWHAFKKGCMLRQTLIEKVQPQIEDMQAFLEENRSSQAKEVRTLCKGLLKKWDSLFTFIYHEGVEPTNNLAERMVRPGVQTRKISYGTRSEKGQILRARLLTVSQTCRIQGRNPLDFLLAAIHANRYGLAIPSLLPIQEHLALAASA